MARLSTRFFRFINEGLIMILLYYMLHAYLPTNVKLTCLHNEGTDQHEVEAVAGVVLPQLHIQGLHHAADGEF